MECECLSFVDFVRDILIVGNQNIFQVSGAVALEMLIQILLKVNVLKKTHTHTRIVGGQCMQCGDGKI